MPFVKIAVTSIRFTPPSYFSNTISLRWTF